MLNKSTIEVSHTKEYQAKLCTSLYKRIKCTLRYEFKHDKLKSEIILYKPSLATLANATEDFDLSEITSKRVQIKYCDGDHVSILDNQLLAKEINEDILSFKTEMDERNKVVMVKSKKLSGINVEHFGGKHDAVKP